MFEEFDRYVESVKAACSLLDIVAADAPDLKRRGSIWTCCSPLRQEKNPSFVVYPDQDSFYDYGISEGGDAIQYVRLRDNADFVTALNTLAGRAGLPTWHEHKRTLGWGSNGEEYNPAYDQEMKLITERHRIHLILTEAAAYYHSSLRSFPDVRRHLVSHYGLENETIDSLKIGFSDGTLFLDFKERGTWDRHHLMQTGLFIESGVDEPHELHEHRIVFPYWNGGTVVYTISRRLEGYTPDDTWQQAKYKKQLTHSEKHSYVSRMIRNDFLWGEDSCRRPQERGLITEGVTDAISAWQRKYPVISPVTVRFKKSDIERLIPVTAHWKRVYIVNDNEAPRLDERTGRMIRPGLDGAKDTALALYRSGRDARIVLLPREEGAEKIDLNEYLRDHDTHTFDALLAASPDYPTFLLSQIDPATPPAQLDELLFPVYETIAFSPSPTLRDLYIADIARRFGITRKTIRECVREFEKRRTTDEAAAKERPRRPHPAEARDKPSTPAPPTASPVPVSPIPVTEPSPSVAPQEARSTNDEPPSDDPVSNDNDVSGGGSAGGGNGDGGGDGDGDGGDGGNGGDGSSDGSESKPTSFAPDLDLLGVIEEDQAGYYEENAGKYTARLTNFVFQPVRKVHTEHGVRLCCDIRTMRTGYTYPEVLLPVNAFRSARDLVTVLQKIDCSLVFSGKDIHVQGLAEHLDRFDVPLYQGASALGYLETADGPRWVAPKQIIGPTGVIKDPRLIYAPSYHAIMANRVDYSGATLPDDVVTKLAQHVIPHLFELNDPEVILSLIGWFSAAAVAPAIRKRTGYFSILWVWGTAGSGKTTIIRDVFWPIFSGVQGDPFSCTDTLFALVHTLASTASIPIVLDEYKHDLAVFHQQNVQRLARRNYTADIEQRGRPDRGVDSYPLHAPMIIIGEQLPDDPALRERLVVVSPLKSSLTPARRAALANIVRFPLRLLAGAWARFVTTRDIDRDLADARAMLASMIDPNSLAPRIAHNLLVLTLGDMLHQAWCRELGVTVPNRPALRSHLKAILAANAGDEEEALTMRDLFDNFIEQVAIYAQLGLVKEGVHYAMVDGKLCVYLEGCRQAYLVERRRAGQPDESLSARSLRRVAKEKLSSNSYIIDRSRQVELSEGHRPRCFVLDKEILLQQLGIEFPIAKNRQWGGNRRHSPADEDDTGWN